MRAFVLGATGEVGRLLVNALCANESFTAVVLIGRRNFELSADKSAKVRNCIVDFDKLAGFESEFHDFDAGFCCLGTTRAVAGTTGFVKVDRDYVLEAAGLAKKAGCRQFHVVTSAGANKDSWFLYPKTKGVVESELAKLEFERLAIYRPSVLLCDRQVIFASGSLFILILTGFHNNAGRQIHGEGAEISAG